MPERNKFQELKGSADRDLVALGIATAAIILFVGTGGTVLPAAMNALRGVGAGPDALLVNALLLNVVLVIFGWRRYRELKIEIGERRNAENQARKLAETDPLTGCLNRRSIASVTEELREVARTQGLAVVFGLVDFDNFKQINDMNGHTAGDCTLIEMAKRIKLSLPNDAHLARIGGDEF
ncbi:MAG: GGDEF domain-containing protein, partial [Erythrobacter sp.]|uniref:GGDEF domain-containing protein n=1 Tax=Erythrobacter sp. TaxID=1042 RepID=UPI003297C105